jgi:hypothetical protein
MSSSRKSILGTSNKSEKGPLSPSLKSEKSLVSVKSERNLKSVQSERNLLSTSNNNSRQNVRVICRVRPGNDIERANGSSFNCFEIHNNNTTIATIENTPQFFHFDYIFDTAAKQDDVFRQTAEPLIDDLLSGYNATVFAYGQTGAGKVRTNIFLSYSPI